MKTYNIGAVVFFHKHTPAENPDAKRMGCNARDACLSGAERIAALRACYRREPIPNDLIPFVYGVGELTPDQIDWDTAGECVTK